MTTDLFDRTYKSAMLSPDGVYRYQLRRYWGDGNDDLTCGFVMLNPSTADVDVDDPTIRRCMGFARGWGYQAILVVNLFALRATNPRELKGPRRPVNPHVEVFDPVGPENDHTIAVAMREMDMVVCAWGAHPFASRRAAKVIAVLRSFHACPDIRCLGTTKDGAPRHPLYVKSDVHPVPFIGGAS